jgi:prophage regulatory protein
MSEHQIVRMKAVCELTQLHKSTIYGLIKEKNFPSPIQLTKRAVCWKLKEVEEWLASRPVKLKIA